MKHILWSKNPLYIPERSLIDTQKIFGYSLIIEGLPRLTVSWEVGEENTYSMIHLFNFSKEVPYESLCAVLSSYHQR